VIAANGIIIMFVMLGMVNKSLVFRFCY